MKNKFKNELTQLLNKYSMENGSNTPDFIIAQYLLNCLAVFNSAVISREDWYGRNKTAGINGLSGEYVKDLEDLFNKFEAPKPINNKK